MIIETIIQICTVICAVISTIVISAIFFTFIISASLQFYEEAIEKRKADKAQEQFKKMKEELLLWANEEKERKNNV